MVLKVSKICIKIGGSDITIKIYFYENDFVR